jgi:hypothetical protein
MHMHFDKQTTPGQTRGVHISTSTWGGGETLAPQADKKTSSIQHGLMPAASINTMHHIFPHLAELLLHSLNWQLDQ